VGRRRRCRLDRVADWENELSRCARRSSYSANLPSRRAPWRRLNLRWFALSFAGALVSSNLTKVGAGLVCLPIGVALFLVAVSLALRRFGIPADLAFLIVALFVIAAGAIALISGLRGLKPSRLAPSKSISQISSLLGEFQDGADVR
jgi:hypothetical protein